MPSAHGIISSIRKKEIIDLLAEDKRLDGRGLTDYREIRIETGLIEKASGSAQIFLGKTKVLIGVKIETGTPYPDKPDDGVLTVNVELVPLASPTFEPGPPNKYSIELARVVDRGIRESKAVDLSKLCIIPGKLVFIIFVDIYVLDYNGNLFDASALASIAALLNARMRKYVVKDEEVKYKETYVKLPLQNFPVTVSIGKKDSKMIVDPLLDEERILDTILTVAIRSNGEICAMQKRGIGMFSEEEIIQAVNIAQEKAAEMREKVLGELIDEWQKA